VKITLHTPEGAVLKVSVPFDGADHAIAEGACIACGAAAFKIGGSGRRASADDRAWESDGYALCCRAPVGLIRVEMNTLFGVREDEAVLRGRCRVY
jgi:hypothetical protein